MAPFVEKIFCNNNFCKEIFDLVDKDENNPNPKLPVDELFLFEFALRAGAIMLYQILQASRYSQYKQQQTLSYNYDISNTLKNEYLLKYIQNALNSVQLLRAFENWYPIYRRLKPDPEGILEVITNEEEARIVKQQQKDKSLFPSILELREGEFEELELKFKNTFPELFKDLERIRTIDIPNEIDWQKHSLDEDPDVSKCGGEAFI